MASRFYSLVLIIATGLSSMVWQPELSFMTTQAQTITDRKTEGDRLNNLGNQQLSRSQYQEALQSYQAALEIYRDINNLEGEGGTLESIGFIYRETGKFDKALEIYQKALVISKELGDSIRTGFIIHGIGATYFYLSQYEKALELDHQALKIFREGKHRRGESIALNSIGFDYERLGSYKKALEFYEQSLLINRELKILAAESGDLQGIGRVYSALKQYSKALEFQQQSLAIIKRLDNPTEEIYISLNIGRAYFDIEQYTKALEFQQQALKLSQKLAIPQTQAIALLSIGQIYLKLGKDSEALTFYQQALAIQQKIGSRGWEEWTLSAIANLLKKNNQPELAVIFYKQSVNITESIRKDIRGLDKELQKSYLATVESTYRNLADLLLKQDRILEAQQVLDLLKVQELSDYLKTVRGNSQTAKGVDIQLPEQNIIALGNELAELQKLDCLTPTQEQRLAYLTNQESDRNQQFNAFLQSPEVQKQIEQLSLEKAKNVDLEEYNRLRESLSQVKNAALFYPLILDDRLELILITATTPPIRKTVNLKREELNKSISDFMSSLRDPSSSDVKDDGQKFYNYLIKPFEKELEEAKIQTIIYAPDGQLRYIPLAALYDGKQWLVERYRINNITASSLTNLRPRTYKQPRVLAAAATNSQNVNSIAFGALPATKTEVEAIASLIPRTTILLDRQFNKTDTVPKMQSNTIVHLATHGYFAVGQPEESFIVFGDSSSASIADIKKWTLTNVELVVLSACETAIGGKVGNGIEILGLGYQIQSAGAGASIASLWKVSDEGTQALMQKLYESLKQKDMSSSEALRQGQIAMIHSDRQGMGSDRASIRVVRTLPNAPSGQFSHPFYWSAFILIGNGL